MASSSSSSEQMFQVVTNPMNLSTHGSHMDIESPTPTTPTTWTSNLLDCLKDEESCWWGTWCSCLLQARTVNAFDLKLSKYSIMEFVICTVGWVFVVLFISRDLGILTLVIGAGYLAFTRGEMRHGIRQRLAYQNRPYFCCMPVDYILHFFICCSPCTICQESREGKAYGLRKIDFCSGQPLSELIQAHERAIGRQSNDASDILIPSNGNFLSHITALSRLSRMLLVASLLALSIVALLLFSRGLIDQVGILLFIFVQPIIILYFFYWRTRRQYASLDMTIKMFMTGFWVSTFQAIIVEGTLQILLTTILSVGFGIDLQNLASSDDSNSNNNNYNYNSTDNGSNSNVGDRGVNMRTREDQNSNDMVTVAVTLMYKLQEWTNDLQGNGSNNYSSNQNNDYISSGGDYGNRVYLESTDDMGVDDPSLLQELQKNVILVIFMCFLVSFCIAAGVEETCKHFAVRNCLRINPLKDPNAIMVYLMSAALGFATSENIEYVLGSGSSSPIPGYSAGEGQLIVLLARWCSPVHVICSVLQAVSLSYAVMDMGTKNLFMILLPAICLHGTFDFTMFVADAISVIYKVNNDYFFAWTITCAAVIVIVSTTYACIAYKKVEDLYNNRWSSLSGDDEHDDADFVEIQF